MAITVERRNKLNIAKNLVDALKGKKKVTGYDATATVKRVEGKTAWVSIPGGVDETPVRMSINVKAGDKVNVRIAGGQAWITGNDSAPPTDDKTANEAKTKVKEAVKEVKKVERKIENGDFDGRSVTAVIAQYCLANANTIPVGQTFEDIQYSSWQATIPTYVTGKFYWMRLEIHYSDGTTEYNAPIFDLGTQVSIEADLAAEAAASAAEDAEEIAQQALDGVGNLENHFWADSSGAHVAENEGTVATGASQTISSNGTVMMRNGKLVTSWTGSESGNAAVNFYDCSSASARDADLVASYGRTGITQYINNIVAMALTASGLSFYTPDSNHYLQAAFGSSGVNLYAAGKLAMALATGQLIFYDSDGTTPITSLGAARAVIGKLSGGHVIIDAAGAHFYQGANLIANLGYETGKPEGAGPQETKPFFTVGSRGGTIGNFSMAIGDAPIASGFCSYASGVDAIASGDFAHAEGRGNGAGGYTRATGEHSRANGRVAEATGNYSHAEGEYTEASGDYSHAEGSGAIASGDHSHAEGNGAIASGDYSHAEGSGAVASGDYSHAEGNGTQAEYEGQTAIGKFNEVGVPDYAFIAGNGTSDDQRSNAFAVEWGGDVRIAGDLYLNCKNPDLSDGNLMSDYVIEQNGGSGNSWAYRKWAGGILECWRTFYGIQANVTTAQGNGFHGSYAGSSWDYPVEFAEIPTVHISIGNTEAWGNPRRGTGTKKAPPTIDLFSFLSSNKTIDLHILAVGRWK